MDALLPDPGAHRYQVQCAGLYLLDIVLTDTTGPTSPAVAALKGKSAAVMDTRPVRRHVDGFPRAIAVVDAGCLAFHTSGTLPATVTIPSRFYMVGMTGSA